MHDPKIEAVKAYLEAARRQDFPAMLAVFADDLVYRVHGRGPLSGETHGKSAALDYFGKVMELTGGTYSITGVVDWLASSERVALVANESATRHGKNLEWTRVIVFRFRENLIAEVSLFDDRQTELDELLGA